MCLVVDTIKAESIAHAQTSPAKSHSHEEGSTKLATPNTAPLAPRSQLRASTSWRTALADTVQFWKCLLFFIYSGRSYSECPYFADRVEARVQVYSLSLVFFLWNKPHYRNGTFQQDMVKNLRNVALPGTGLALSYFCYFRVVALFSAFVLYPLASLLSALVLRRNGSDARDTATLYLAQLLAPEDWFSFWRLNCRLASYHAHLTHEAGYAMEDKFRFLQQAEAAGIAVSPSYKAAQVVVKDRNEEGGMGIRFFSNAHSGGDWIIQPRLSNSDEVASLLPDRCPLSTVRVVTASTHTLSEADGGIEVLSTVFRAGREGADTDHKCIMFDVDARTGEIGRGTTNSHWYQLGASKLSTSPLVSAHDITHHPDTQQPITGHKLSQLADGLALAQRAHAELMPDVPLVGWDVAFTAEHGALLLEGNLSCNFFRGSFDRQWYFNFVDSLFRKLSDSK